MTDTVIVLFRRDLRLSDNGALYSAADSGFNLIPVYIHDTDWLDYGAPGRAWLYHSLHSLDEELQRYGSRLIVRHGAVMEELEKLAKESGAFAIYLNTIFEPKQLSWEEKLESWGRSTGITVKRFNSSLLHQPEKVLDEHGKPFKNFTPFYNACLQHGGEIRPPFKPPAAIKSTIDEMDSVPVDALGLCSTSAMDDAFSNYWAPSEQSALANLLNFVNRRLMHYQRRRDQLSKFGTSRLSPYLSWGQLSPVQVIWASAKNNVAAREPFVRQLYWREFAYYLLYHYPHSVNDSLDPKFTDFPWNNDLVIYEVWTQGETGIPLVDAGMREMLATGWMHHRARMMTASFLAKNMLVDWRKGVEYFMSASLDADLACNVFGWQWVSGCGIDGIPFFRVFNPITHGEKYDPDGSYVRHWCPELSALPDEWLHRPWEAPDDVLSAAGIRLGKDYPEPVVDPKGSRHKALDLWSRIRQG